MSAAPLAVETPKEDVADVLTAVELFRDLPRPVLKAIEETAEERRYGAGETVYSPGQFYGGEFLYIACGRLKAAFANPHSSAMFVEEFGGASFFYLAEAMAGGESEYAATLTLSADIDTRVLAFSVEDFRAVAARRPLLTRNLMQHFAQALVNARTEGAPTELSSERRVFAALLEYVERDAVSGDWRVARMPKHRELGEKAGADEAATANAIARLIQDGVARRDYPGLVIDDIAQLNRLAR